MNSKDFELMLLDRVCEKVMQEGGTLKTSGMNYDYHIEKQVKACELAGANRKDIQMILCKFQPWMTLTSN
jgi:hypothetical protein